MTTYLIAYRGEYYGGVRANGTIRWGTRANAYPFATASEACALARPIPGCYVVAA